MKSNTYFSRDPITPISILEIHGTADTEVPYSGMPDIGGGWGPSGSTPEVIDFWVAENQCVFGDSYSVENTTDLDGTTTDVVEYVNGLEGSIVRLYTVNDGPHDWPGWYNAEADMIASEEIWKFMEDLCAESMGVAELPLDQFSLYPNPTTGAVYLGEANLAYHSNVEVVVYNAAMTEVLRTSQKQFDLTDMDAGLYFVVVNHQGSTWSGRVIKE